MPYNFFKTFKYKKENKIDEKRNNNSLDEEIFTDFLSVKIKTKQVRQYNRKKTKHKVHKHYEPPGHISNFKYGGELHRQAIGGLKIIDQLNKNRIFFATLSNSSSVKLLPEGRQRP